ncbi:DDE_3 domain-containing protein [Trichonephila clavipes]|nr:DDE_3 domain-containing protein [Trichonephila clavipes]
MTGHIYRDVILEQQHVRLFRGAMGSEFLFMDDNARPHHESIVGECLQSEDIIRMDWPEYSPDLNRIEHVWDMLSQRIAAHHSACLGIVMPVLHRPGYILRMNYHTNHVILFIVNRFFFEICSRNESSLSETEDVTTTKSSSSENTDIDEEKDDLSVTGSSRKNKVTWKNKVSVKIRNIFFTGQSGPSD